MIYLATQQTTGTVHAMVGTDGQSARPGPDPLRAACGRNVSGSLSTGIESDVTCGDCRSKPLHLPTYRLADVGDTVTVTSGGIITPGMLLRATEWPTAWPENVLTPSWTHAVILARQYVADGQLTGAVVWSAGGGNYAVNGWRES